MHNINRDLINLYAVVVLNDDKMHDTDRVTTVKMEISEFSTSDTNK